MGAELDNSTYPTLTRQSGLMREMQIVANNIANLSTTGFRQQGLVFGEYITGGRNAPSVSMATANVPIMSQTQGGMTQTKNMLDFAIEGDGYFIIATTDGPRLTRDGSFSIAADGTLVTNTGDPVADEGGASIILPAMSGPLNVGPDGTIMAGSSVIGQLTIVMPSEGTRLIYEDGVRFRPEGAFERSPNGRVRQGFLEASNVDPVGQIARMIEVQRAYELGQSFLDAENERIKSTTQTITR